MASEIKQLYDFGAFRMDPAEHLLLRDSTPVELTPKAFDTLLKLVENPGRLLTKADLMELIWPDTVVEENNLTQTIYMLRKALGETENGARLIETVPRKGYRFAAQVRARQKEAVTTASGVNGNGASPGAGASRPPLVGPAGETNIRAITPDPELESRAVSAPGPSSGRRPSLKSITLGVAAVALAAILIGIGRWHDRIFGPRAMPIRSLAVLPLENLSGDRSQDYFADGVTEELITDLAELGPLQVTSRTSVMQYKNARKPLKEIARELNVDAVVEGAAIRSGDRLRITAQLIRASTDTHLWANSYDGNLGDILNFESQAAREIAREVAVKLTPEASARLERVQHVDPEAHELYLKGRYLWDQRTPDQLDKATGYFSQAIERDPNYAPAYAGLADGYDLIAMDAPQPLDLLAKAKTAAIRAIRLDDKLPEAHTSLAGVKILGDWDWAGAEQEFKRALQIDPQYAPAHHWYATLCLAPQGRIEEASAEMRRALVLEPASPIYMTDLGWTLYVARHYDQAIRQYQQVVEMNPTFEPAHFRLSQVYQAKEMYPQALDETLTADSLMLEGKPEALSQVYKKSGYRGVLETRLKYFRELDNQHRTSAYGRARVYVGLRDKLQALEALRTGLEVHDPAMIYLKIDPEWDSLRSKSEFRALEQQVGLTP